MQKEFLPQSSAEIVSELAWLAMLAGLFGMFFLWACRRMSVDKHLFGLRLTKVFGFTATIIVPLVFFIVALIQGRNQSEAVLVTTIAAASLATFTLCAILLLQIGLHLRVLVLIRQGMPPEGENELPTRGWLWVHRVLSKLHGADVIQRLRQY